MKIGGIIVAVVGAALIVWHLAMVLTGTDVDGNGLMRHTTLSLVGGVMMFVGIWLYTVGRRARRRTPLE